MPDGCLVVCKPRGCSSHDVIARLRRNYKIKCGHAGTLDPMAQGVLLVFTGRALKLLNFIPTDHLDKTYLMRVTLGATTDSYDATGNIVTRFENPIQFSNEELVSAMRSLVGSYEQVPPVFSAIKVGGKRAYAMARAGEDVKLASRPVHVTSIRLVKDYQSNGERHLVLRVHCSRGTYVRSIAHDLGQKLGCGGYLSYLLRERVGQWAFTQALPFWKIEQKLPFEQTSSFVPFSEILPFPKLKVSAEGQSRVKTGQAISRRDIISLETETAEAADTFQILAPDGRLIAIYTTRNEREDSQKGGLKLFPVRVFANDEA